MTRLRADNETISQAIRPNLGRPPDAHTGRTMRTSQHMLKRGKLPITKLDGKRIERMAWDI
jgi:hypothetical protein